MRDFTLSSYQSIIGLIGKKGLAVYSVSDWLLKAPGVGVVIRHDVDRRPENALAMARVEASAGITSTFYFRMVRNLSRPKIIREIADLGHEVGYHYEDLALANGNMETARRLFKSHLASLRSIAPVVTVAMHGSPLSRHNNLNLWQTMTLAENRLVGEAFLSVDYSDTYYFTDTGRGWDSGKTNLRDRPTNSLNSKLEGPGTKHLLSFLERTEVRKMALSAHPERWDTSVSGWCYQLSRDLLSNSAKRILAVTR